jgi:tetratricopeptide (TPR) repeat protein
VAVAANLLAEAETHFLEASRLEPQNAVHQLNLSVVRLHGTNAAMLAEARGALKSVSENTTNAALRCQALRELVVDAVRHNETNAALTLTKNLVGQTNSTFQDKILRLDLLRVTQKPEFKPMLATCQREAAEDPAKVQAMATWGMSKISPQDTLVWLTNLPASTQTNQPVPVLIADCYAVVKDWTGLQAYLATQRWGADLEFLRHAYLTRALKGRELTGAAKAEWELAVKTANNQKQALGMLLRMAAQWSWMSEGEELLWAIVNRFPEEKWAFSALSQVLFQGGRTRPLMQLYSQQVKRFPSDLSIQNNLAMTAMLLEAKELKPHDIARDVYAKASTNISYASTYAFSLHLQEKDAEALKILEALKPKDLENPSIAGYYGLILKSTGNSSKANTYLDLASKIRVLPEEKKLFDRAKTGA